MYVPRLSRSLGNERLTAELDGQKSLVVMITYQQRFSPLVWVLPPTWTVLKDFLVDEYQVYSHLIQKNVILFKI